MNRVVLAPLENPCKSSSLNLPAVASAPLDPPANPGVRAPPVSQERKAPQGKWDPTETTGVQVVPVPQETSESRANPAPREVKVLQDRMAKRVRRVPQEIRAEQGPGDQKDPQEDQAVSESSVKEEAVGNR